MCTYLGKTTVRLNIAANWVAKKSGPSNPPNKAASVAASGLRSRHRSTRTKNGHVQVARSFDMPCESAPPLSATRK